MSEAVAWAFIIAAFALLAVWIARPLLSPRGRREGDGKEYSSQEQEIDRLIEEKTAVYRAMLDLEFDHQLGKVADNDYAIMRRQHESEAVAILKALDSSSSVEALVDVLEKEIATARSRIVPPETKSS